MRRIISVIILALFLLMNPTVFAIFQLEIYPDMAGPIQPGVEAREIVGFAYYQQPSSIIKLIPGAFFWQSFSISIKEKPEWAIVTITPSESIMKFDTRENISIVVSVKETAPAYEYGVIRLDIESGLYGRNKPLGKSLPSYPADRDIAIQAGYLPLLTPTTSGAREGKPNSQISHMITLKNSGNARSRLDFSVNVPEIDQEIGWSAQQPTSVFVDVGQTIDVPLTIITPNSFGYIDDWAQITVDVKVSSPLEPTSNNTATFTVPTTSHCVGSFVPGVPGGNNPGIILIAIIVIIAIIIFALKNGLSFIGKIRKKQNVKKNKDTSA
ncbi:MAG: hypothetical protein DRN27_02520 [Thermoplasmata archaeon]|nr:MAG: hypothetical protein DRN27_02520 [Thermoplasmata archaeon]